MYLLLWMGDMTDHNDTYCVQFIVYYLYIYIYIYIYFFFVIIQIHEFSIYLRNIFYKNMK